MANAVTITITGKDGVSQTFAAIGRNADQMANKVESGSKKSAASLQKMQTAALAAGTAMFAAAGKAGDAHLKETNQLKALERVYGESADEIEAYAQSLQSMGIASDDATRIAALGAQSLAKNYELTTDQILQLIERSADLTQVTFDQYGNQLGLADIMQRVSAAMRGEAESAEILGVAMNDQRMATLAAEQGLTGWTTTMTDAEKAAFRLKVFLEDTNTAQGAAAEKAGTLSGQINALKLGVSDLGSTFGGVLGPLGSVAGALDDIAVPLLAVGTTLSAMGISISAPTVALGGLAAGLGTVGLAAVALAAPVGIATYLILDQSNVMARATEETLKNKDALEGYITYLKSIDTPAEFIPEMSQDMKELLDWVTKVGDGIDTGLIQASNTTGAFSTNLGELDDTIRRLDPANLEAVKILADQLGIVFTDPATWNPDSINLLSNYIVTLSRAQTDATYDALELSRATQSLKTDVYEAAIVMDDAAVSVAYLNTQMAVSEDSWLGLQDLTKDAAVGLQSAATGADAATENIHAMTVAIDELGKSLKDANPAAVLDRTFKAIVGNTNAMVGSIDTAKKWADELIAPVGTYSTLDDLMTKGKISIGDYAEAQEAQTQITEDYNRALEASQVIQARQAPLIAEQTDATADYLESLSKLPEQEQMLALAWGDQDLAGRATDIADMAANYDNMSDAQKEAFESLVSEAAAADPVLAAMLEKMGLISIGADGTITINDDDLGNANDQMDDLTDALNNLADVIGMLMIDYTSADAASGLLGTLATQMANLDGKTATVYINGVRTGFVPGDDGYATGGMVNVRLAEMGPERLQFANGGSAIAPHDGNYLIPNGTYVSPAAATRAGGGGPVGKQMVFNAPVYIYPATPDIHDAISSTLLRGGR